MTEHQWQPIETCPRDGTEFQAWVFDPSRLAHEMRGWWEPKCRFDGDTFEIWTRVDYDMDGWESGYRATHWLPLPAPPKG